MNSKDLAQQFSSEPLQITSVQKPAQLNQFNLGVNFDANGNIDPLHSLSGPKQSSDAPDFLLSGTKQSPKFIK